MQRLSKYAIGSVIALLVVPLTTSSQLQKYPPESSPLKTSRAEQPQGASTQATKFYKSKRPIANRYIVVLRDDVVADSEPIEVRRAAVTAIANRHAQTYGGKFDYIYETALKGYAIELANEAAAIAISNLPEVRWVEEDALGLADSAGKNQVVSKSFEAPAKLEAVCLGKPVPVLLMEPLNELKVSGRRLPFLNGGISQRARLVIRDRDEFNKFWQELFRSISHKPALPEIDFSREMIIVAAMGQQPSSGYEVIIDSACEVDNRFEVLVRSTNFLKCGLQLGVVTEPVDIVRLPKTVLPVTFREIEVTSDCNELFRR